MLFYLKSGLYLAFNDFAFFKHSFYRKRRLLKRVPYLFIFVIRENEILIAVIRDSLFFLFVNRARDPPPPPPPPCTTLFYLCSLLTALQLTSSCAGQKQPRSTVPLSRHFYVRRHVNFTPENEKNRTSLNFYFCNWPFIHCFYFIYARKIYMRTQVKITPQWKSTLSRFT